MYSGDGKNRNHSGEGHVVMNVITFVILFAILLAGFYATSYSELGSAWGAWFPMGAVILGGTIAYGVALLFSRRTLQHPDVVANEAAQDDVVDAEYRQAVGHAAKH